MRSHTKVPRFGYCQPWSLPKSLGLDITSKPRPFGVVVDIYLMYRGPYDIKTLTILKVTLTYYNLPLRNQRRYRVRELSTHPLSLILLIP